jgi:hypothetical protein
MLKNITQGTFGSKGNKGIDGDKGKIGRIGSTLIFYTKKVKSDFLRVSKS